jgi:hypothetical protein
LTIKPHGALKTSILINEHLVVLSSHQVLTLDLSEKGIGMNTKHKELITPIPPTRRKKDRRKT